MYLYTFLSCFNTIMPFWGAYLLSYYNYTSTNIILFFSIFSITVFLTELPIGFISDRLKSKVSVTIGMTLKTFSLLIILVLQYPIVPFISQVIAGLGESFCSGSRDVLTYRYYKSGKVKESFESFNARLYSVNWAGVVTAFLVASLLTRFSLKAVLVANFIAFFISTIAVIALDFSDSLTDNNFNMLKQIKNIKAELGSNRQLMFVLIFSSLIQATLSAMFLLFQPLFNDLSLNTVNNGYIYALVTLFAILGSTIQLMVQKRLNKDSLLFSISMLLMILLCFSLSVFSSLLMVIINFCIFRFTFGFTGPFIASAVNKAIKIDDIRASIFSLISMLLSLMQSLILYLLQGLMITMQSRYFILMCLLAFITVCFIIMNRKQNFVKNQN